MVSGVRRGIPAKQAEPQQPEQADEAASVEEHAAIEGDAADDTESTTPDRRRPPTRTQPSQPSQESKREGRVRARTTEQSQRAAVERRLNSSDDDVIRTEARGYSTAKTVGDVYREAMGALTSTDLAAVSQNAQKGQFEFQGRARAAYEAFLAKSGYPDTPGARAAFANVAVAQRQFTDAGGKVVDDASDREFKKQTFFAAFANQTGQDVMASPSMRPFIDAVLDPKTKLTDAERNQLNTIYVSNGDGTRTSLYALRNRAGWDANVQQQLKPGMPGVGFKTTIDAGFAWQQPDPGRYAFTTAASRAGYSLAEINLAMQETQRRGAPLWGTGAGFNSAFTSREDYIERGAGKEVAGRLLGEYTIPDYAVRDLQDARLAIKGGYKSVDEYRKNLGNTPGTVLTETITSVNTSIGGFLERNGLDSPIARGAREAVNEYAQVAGNLTNLGAMLAYKPYAGIVKGDIRLQSDEENAFWNAAPRRLENAVAAANEAIPKEQGNVGEFLRAGTKGLATAPVYAAGTVAPPIMMFWNAGKYANKPVDEFGKAMATDALSLMTGRLADGPLASAVTKKLSGAGASEAQALLAGKGASAVANAVGNVAPQAGEAAFQLYVQDPSKLSPEQRAALEKQLSLGALTQNAALGFGMTLLSPAHRDVDAQVGKGGTILGDIYATERPGGRAYSGVVKTRDGRVEFLELDARDPQVRAKMNKAIAMDAGQVDLALIQSRAAHRVKPGDVNTVVEGTTQFAQAKFKADVELAAAATKPSVDTGVQAARLDALERFSAPGADALAKLGLEKLEPTFGPGPYTPALARLAERPGFAEFAAKNPKDARYLYEMNQAMDVPGYLRTVEREVGPGPKALETAVDRLRNKSEITVQREGNFVVVERRRTLGEPGLEMVLAPDKDHNGAFAQYAPVFKDGELNYSGRGDLIQPTRIDLNDVRFKGGQRLQQEQIAMVATHGGPNGLDGGSNREIALQLARRLKDRPDIKGVILVACHQGDRTPFSSTNAVEFQRQLNQAMKDVGATQRIAVSANDARGPTAPSVKEFGGAMTGDVYVVARPDGGYDPAGPVRYVPAGEHKFYLTPEEKQAALAAAAGGAGAATTFALGAGAYYVYSITVGDDEEQR